MPLMILAENFDGLWIIIFAVPLALVALAGVSFVPATRGHWAGPAMATPAIGLSMLLFASAALGRGPCVILLIALLPAIVGVASMMVWAEKRRRD